MRSACEESGAGVGLVRRRRRADRLARLNWLILLLAVAIGLLGGTVVAVAAPSRPAAGAAREADLCTDPPCFDIGGLPGVEDLPMVLTGVCSLVAVLLGIGWEALHGRWAQAGRHVLGFVGPVLVVAGTEVIPHMLAMCALLPRLARALAGAGVTSPAAFTSCSTHSWEPCR